MLSLELMLVLWGLFMGAPGIGAGTSGGNGGRAALTLVNLQPSAATHATHRVAKARPARISRPKWVAPDPSAPVQATTEPDPGVTLADAGAAAFVPLSGKHGAQDPCSLAQDLATDLQTDPGAQHAVQSVLPQSLSVAGALLLWDGHWVVPDAADAGASMLRTIVLREIAAAKPECLAEVNPGPQFLFINGSVKTVTIVIGSGQWRWADLAAGR